MLNGKVQCICSMKDFESGYLLYQTEQDGLVLRKYSSSEKYEVVSVFPKGWSLLNECHWNTCIQEARRVIGRKTKTIYWYVEDGVE